METPLHAALGRDYAKASIRASVYQEEKRVRDPSAKTLPTRTGRTRGFGVHHQFDGAIRFQLIGLDRSKSPP